MSKKIKYDHDTKCGMIIYFGYYLLKTLLFILNVFVLYKWFKGQFSFIILSLVLNTIFFLFFNLERLYLLIPALILVYFNSKGVISIISISLALTNSIGYVIDFVIFLVNTLLINILSGLSRLK